jgi:hypothetical protein
VKKLLRFCHVHKEYADVAPGLMAAKAMKRSELERKQRCVPFLEDAKAHFSLFSAQNTLTQRQFTRLKRDCREACNLSDCGINKA